MEATENQLEGSALPIENQTLEDHRKLVELLEQRHRLGHYATDIGSDILLLLNPYELNVMDIDCWSTEVSQFVETIFTAMQAYQRNVCVVIQGLAGKDMFYNLCHKFETRTQKERESLHAKLKIILDEIGNCGDQVEFCRGRMVITHATFLFGFDQELAGSTYSSYLCEKASVNPEYSSSDQLSVNVFFDMLYGMPDEMIKNLHLTRNHQAYHFLKSQGKETTFASNPDQMKQHYASRYSSFHDALQTLVDLGSIDSNVLQSIWRILAALLHLGNVAAESSSSGQEGVFMVTDKGFLLSTVATLLGLSYNDLISALRSVPINEPSINTAAKVQFGSKRRHILSQLIFLHVASWLVRKVNQSLCSHQQEIDNFSNKRMIDLFYFPEFESLREKSPSVYANFGKLRQLHQIKAQMEQSECAVEGIHLGKVVNEKSPANEFVEESVVSSTSHYSYQADPWAQEAVVDCCKDNVNGLMENADLYGDTKTSLSKSKDWLLASIFSTETFDHAPKDNEIVQKFIQELEDSVMAQTKTSFYAFSIVPSNSRVSEFDANFVSNQLTDFGLPQSAKFRQTAFAFTIAYPKFLMRYKCLSEYTWPNFRGASIQEGVKIILQQYNLLSQCFFGRTKLFIKTWKPVQYLEQKRSQVIPHIVTYLQKTWKGSQARRLVRYHRMTAKILHYYRRFKLRWYLAEIKRSLSQFTSSEKYAFSVDATPLQWPQPPIFVARTFEISLKKTYNRWRAYLIMSPLDKNSMADVKLKIYAYPLVRDKCVKNKFTEEWIGNYLADDDENVFSDEYIQAVESIKRQYPFKKILFSSFIQKYNKMGKCATRVLLVTDSQVFKLHAQGRSKFLPMKPGLDLQNLRAITISAMNDGLVVLDFGNKNDFVFYFSRGGCRVVEFVGTLAMEFDKLNGRPVSVIISNNFKFHIGGRTRQMILMTSHNKIDDEPYFSSRLSVVKFYWPLKELR